MPVPRRFGMMIGSSEEVRKLANPAPSINPNLTEGELSKLKTCQ